MDIVTTPGSETAPTVSIIHSGSIHEFIRYFVASAIALAADSGSLWLLTSIFNVPYLISGAVAFLLGLTIVYLLSVKWVFEHRGLRNPRAEFLIFAGIGVVGLGLNELTLWIMTGMFEYFYLISKFASVIVVFLWNFGARKMLLFRGEDSDAQAATERHRAIC